MNLNVIKYIPEFYLITLSKSIIIKTIMAITFLGSLK